MEVFPFLRSKWGYPPPPPKEKNYKLLVWLKFTKALSDFMTKKDMKFFFQTGKGKYKPIFGIIIIFK